MKDDKVKKPNNKSLKERVETLEEAVVYLAHVIAEMAEASCDPPANADQKAILWCKQGVGIEIE